MKQRVKREGTSRGANRDPTIPRNLVPSVYHEVPSDLATSVRAIRPARSSVALQRVEPVCTGRRSPQSNTFSSEPWQIVAIPLSV